MTVSRRLRGGLVLAALALMAGLVAIPGDIHGQPRPAQKLIAAPQGAETEKPFTDAVTLPVDREARRLIQAAQDYIKKKEWRIASECLQSLLENREDSFLEVETSSEPGKTEKRRVSVRTEANRLIGELPPDGLEFYQVQYGQAADARLKEALEKNDSAILAEVAQRYLHTQAGGDATALLATYHLDRGSYLMAALCFERLLSRADAEKLSARSLFKAALAFKQAGDAASSEKVWKRLTEKAGRGELTLGKQKVTLDQLRAELNRPASLIASLAPRDTYVFRSNAARSALGAGGTAFLEPRWTASMTPRDEAKEDLEGTAWIKLNLEIAFKLMENKPILPCFFPIAAGNNLLYRTYDGVYCVALHDIESADGKHKAGEMLWNSVTSSGLHGMARTPDRKTALDTWYSGPYRQPGYGPVGILFENSVVGTLSHDTQRVYFVDDMAVPPHQSMLVNQNIVGANIAQFGPFAAEMKSSQLTAVDIETGKLAWRVPPRENDRQVPAGTATELSEAFFLGPPLPLGGKLYVLIEKNTEFRLVCLDPSRLDASGYPEILWNQSLGTANVKMAQDSMRRVQAAHLSYADGILVCPLNAGAVIGIDLLSHSLVWAYSYRDGTLQSPGDDLPGIGVFGRGGRMGRPIYPSGPPAQERWRTSAPVIVNGKVVFTAHDAGHLHCLNLRDGRLLWNVKREDDDLYLAGVFGSHVVIVGKSSVRALNLDEGPRESWGKVVWKMPTGGLPSGQGVASDDVYYLPMQKTGEGTHGGPGILAISLSGGKRISTAAKRNQELPGNLIFAEGDMISQTATGIAAYPQLRVKELEITRRLKDNPNDPVGLTDRGELYLYDGKLSEAVADLRASLAHQPPADSRLKARSKLHEALTELLQDKFSEGEKYLDEYRELCKVEIPAEADAATRQKLSDEQLRREANYLSLVGRGREAQGRLIDALVAYEQFGALTGNKELISVVDEVNTRSRPDVWSRGRIKGMIDKSSADQRRQIEGAINDRYQAIKNGGPVELRKFVAVYGTSFPVGREAQLRLADALIADGSTDALTEAESKLQSLCFAPDIRKQDPAIAARAIDAMIRIYVRRGLYEDAVGLFKQLGEDFKSVVVRDGKTGADLLQELMTDKRFLPYLEAQGAIWKGAFKASDATGNFHTTATSLTIEPDGDLLPFFRRNRLVLDINMQNRADWSFRLLDRATNAEKWKQGGLPAAFYFMNPSLPPNFKFAFARGHVLVLHLNHFVSAYDLTQQKHLWTYNLYGKNPVYANNPQASLMIDPNDGRLTIAHQDGRRERLGGVAVVESSYICLQTREGLVALDLTKPGPSVLWIKAGISVRADVFGDEEMVYVVEGGADGVPTTTRALRAEDGVSVPVPDFSAAYAKRIRTIGRNILIQEDDSGGGKICRLYDVQAGRDVWRQVFTPGAIVMRSEDRDTTGVIEKDRTVTFLDSRSGRVLFRSLIQTDHADKLHGAALVSDANRFYVVLVREKESGLSWSPNLTYGLRSLSVNGPVYALSRATGKLEWACDFLPHQNLLLEQIQDLPMLFFTTAYSKIGSNGNYERNATKVTAIDKATGKLLYDKEFMQPGPIQSVKTDPQAGAIELFRGDLKIAFRLDGNVASAAHHEQPLMPSPRGFAPSGVNGRAAPPPPVRMPVPIIPKRDR